MIEKTLKRIFSVNAIMLASFLTMLLSFTVLSCENGDNGALRVGIIYDYAGKGDGSFNDSAYEGIKRAQEELGVAISEETTDGTAADREKLIQSLAENNDLVIGVGFSFENSIKKAAVDNPDTNFAGVDIPQGENPPANFASLLFNEAQGSFLVGVAAGLKTETDRIGFIGGVCGTPHKLIEKFEAGFVAGAKAVDENIKIETEYLSQYSDPQNPDQPPDSTGFNNPGKAKESARWMFEADFDVVFHAAGKSGKGLFEAAKEFSETEGTKVWTIGVDSDQYETADDSVREYILTSMLKKVDVAVYNIIEAQKNSEFSGGVVDNNLSNDGVGYSTSGGFVDDIKSELEKYKARVINGEIVVPTVSEKGCETLQNY